MSISSDEHLPPRTLRDYRHGRLTPAAALAASDHLAACPACRDALASLDDGPRYEELAAAVDGSLDPASRAELDRRLAEAPRAAEELADLGAFHRELTTTQAGRVYGPAVENAGNEPDRNGASLPPAENVYVPPSGTSWWRRHGALLQSVAAVAAVFLLAVFWWRVGGSKPALEDALLTDARGRPADLAALPADLRDAVARTLREGRVPHADFVRPAELRPPGGVLAGPTAATRTPFLATRPVGVVVRDLRPTLQWTGRAEATGYVVVLDQLGDNAPPAPVSLELPATQTTWTPPEPLVAGAVYTWQVEARRGTETLDRTPQPPAAEARFLVLDATRRAELERVEREFADFPLVTGVALARAGLMDEAAERLGRLAQEHPQSAAAQRLQRGTVASADHAKGWER